MQGVSGISARILIATAAAAVGLAFILYAVPPALAQIGRGLVWRTDAFALGLLMAFALITIAVLRPQPAIAAAGSASTVGPLLFWGTAATPMSGPRLLLHLAAILCLVALLIRLIQGIVDRRFGMLWALAALLLGFPIGLLTDQLMGFHIVNQYCQLPLIGPELSSILCGG